MDRSLTAAWLDLVVGSTCAGCGAPGPAACRSCVRALPPAYEARPSPAPPGLVRCWASGEYAGLLAHAVVAHKERGRTAVAGLLGERLAASVRALVDEAVEVGPRLGTGVPWLLVPVPSRPGVVRARGDDPVARVVRVAARRLRREGLDVRSRTVLRSRPGVVDQAGLGAEERRANLAHSMHCPTPALHRLARAGPVAVVLCDDVLTTGATLAEAGRALTAVGVRPVGAAVVAAVARRGPPRPFGAELRPPLTPRPPGG